jgi:DNA-binding NtrC family response regulator
MSSRQFREKILVADDEQAILDLLERVLGREGYEVATTSSGEEVMGLVASGGFDLAIVDVALPSLNGRKLIKMIKQASPGTAVVVMSGYPAEEILRLAQEHAQGYLEKPFDLREFIGVVRGALEEAPVHESTSSEEPPDRCCGT